MPGGIFSLFNRARHLLHNIQFLLQVIQATSDSQGSEQVVYPLLEAHLNKLNMDFAQLFQTWGTNELRTPSLERKLALATVIGNFSSLIHRFPRGNHAHNLEIAIVGYTISDSVFTYNDYPKEWAMNQFNLSVAYATRIPGEHAQNLEKAILYAKQALRVFTYSMFPEQWAGTQLNLANLYRDRIKETKVQNLEVAIAYAQHALQVYTRQTFPEQWAGTQNNLATMYRIRTRDGKAANLEKALAHAQQALDIYTRQAFPKPWAGTQSNLAIIYYERIYGERIENLEKALMHASQSLEVFADEPTSLEWAMAQHNLAIVYYMRLRGDKVQNLEKAIFHSQQALTVFTSMTFPDNWARTQLTLGNVYRERILGDKAQNLEKAIFHSQQALTVYTSTTFPEQWAGTQNTLGNAYRNRILGDRAQNMEQAIFHYQQALKIYTHTAFPVDWATLQYHLAAVYLDRIHDSGEENIAKSIHHHQLALQIETPESLPQLCRDTAYSLALLLFDQQRYREAYPVFATAHQAVQNIRHEIQRDQTKRQLSQENVRFYAQFVACCLHCHDEQAAFVYTAAGKGRALVDAIASVRFDLLTTAADNPQLAQDFQQLRDLRQQIDAIQSRIASQGRPSSFDTELPQERASLATLRQLQQQEKLLWEDLSFRYPALTATVQTPTLTIEDAQQLSQALDATLVEYYYHAEGWCAFVVTIDTIQYVPLPLITSELLQTMVRWMLNMDIDLRTSPLLKRKPLFDWHTAVIAPLRDYLPVGTRVVLAPHRVLNLFPFNAARDSQTGRYACEDYQLSFAPSLSALWVMHQQADRSGTISANASRHLLNAAYVHTPEHPHYIPGVVAANHTLVQTVAPHFTGLYDASATPDAVVAAVRQQPPPDMIHITAHGGFDPDLPEQSGLELAGGYLTVQRIISEMPLKQTQLVTLASCLLGRASLEPSGEVVGITQAFLTAGARVVVTALWEVEVPATLALFEAFYRRIIVGEPPAMALRIATAELRAMPGWDHPYYWAAWQVYGLGF